jgi:hypothetical protein
LGCGGRTAILAGACRVSTGAAGCDATGFALGGFVLAGLANGSEALNGCAIAGAGRLLGVAVRFAEAGGEVFAPARGGV